MFNGEGFALAMDRSQYQIEWCYSDVQRGESPNDPNLFANHMTFLIRFSDIPGGPDHVARFGVNVCSPAGAELEGLSRTPGRGVLICGSFDYDRAVASVEDSIHAAFLGRTREEALKALNTVFIHDLDFIEHFRDGVLAADAIIEMIQNAFSGMERGAGVTLHQALALDDRADDAEQQRARARDVEARWEDVPDADIAASPNYLCFLDTAGFRYYLPANMRWSLKNYDDDRWGCSFYTCCSLLPTVAPRDVGKGFGEKFDVDEFVTEHFLSTAQVRAIYHFLCFMASVQVFHVGEDEYPAMMKWRHSACR